MFCGCLVLTTTACERESTDPRVLLGSRLNSPEALYHQLRQWHESRSYLSMQPWIHPEARDDLIDLLVAMDELTLAHATAQLVVATSCPDVAPQAFDTSVIVNNLDLFSRDAKYISQDIRGEQGEVTIQVAGRLPLKHLQFERLNGYWVYVPGECDPELSQLVADLAKSLCRIATSLARGPCSREQVLSEYQYRIMSKLGKLSQLVAPAATRPQALGMDTGGRR